MKTSQMQLFQPDTHSLVDLSHIDPKTEQQLLAIEDESFPFEQISEIGESESWRKEVTRPTYHIHKWWAQRLGSVFRSIVIASFAPKGSDILNLFYSPVRVPGVIVFDPFMGSGTTIGEVLKLGGRAIGRDINAVAHFLVRNALTLPARHKILETFNAIARDISPEIHRYYQAILPDGRNARVLYYFWVKQVTCPTCSASVDLFSSYIFAQHAYPARHPNARALCPLCGGIDTVPYNTSAAICTSCNNRYNPSSGPARGASTTCVKCNATFKILHAVKKRTGPPSHRLYAKLVLTPSQEKVYLPADDFDRELYARASRDLARGHYSFPKVQITPGYNTDQVLNYAYTHWHQMFNDRQLLCLSLLAERIGDLKDQSQKDLFCCLFTGVLEFNNMFASFKGEGTGAVRHMFSHHILKPERMPLEANVWGTPRSSGSFSTLFQSRILRALDYAENPFELRPSELDRARAATKKVYGLSIPLSHEVATTFAEFEGKPAYLSCGDSSNTDISTGIIDAVVTDPPFFDNVHYSQLADFFYVWQRHILGPGKSGTSDTTRSEAEVHHSDSGIFTGRLTGVWRECGRVLKDSGLLVFTYHHSRTEGWRSILASLVLAGFKVVRVHPIKAEMSVATPKHQAKEPIDIDMIVVCRKHSGKSVEPPMDSDDLSRLATDDTKRQLERLHNIGRLISRNDVRVVLMAHIVARLSQATVLQEILPQFDALESRADDLIESLHQRKLPSVS